MKAKFYICEHCGNLVTTIHNAGVPLVCCGEKMKELLPNQWLFVETENGGQLRYLAPGQAPKAVFELGGEKPVAVYAYCNLHGLWMTKL